MTASTTPTSSGSGGAPGPGGVPGSPDLSAAPAPSTFDPLRLCIFATIALLGWVLGPLALVWFAGMGFLGYWRARQGGLTRSTCLLRDTRLVLLYLGLLVLAGVAGIVWVVNGWVVNGWVVRGWPW